MTPEQIKYARQLGKLYAYRLGYDADVALSREEMERVVMEAAVRAMNDYDAERSPDWKKFMSFRAYFACVDHIRRVTQNRSKERRFKPMRRLRERDRLSKDSASELEHSDQGWRDDAFVTEDFDFKIDLERALDGYPDGRDKNIFLLYLLGNPMSRIAERENLTAARISQIINHVRDFLSGKLPDYKKPG